MRSIGQDHDAQVTSGNHKGNRALSDIAAPLPIDRLVGVFESDSRER